MKLIVGLGNPGEKYAGTRHNLGFIVLDEFARKHLGPKIEWTEDKKFKAQILDLTGKIGGIEGKFLLIKPLTFMNNSGLAVQSVISYLKVKQSTLIIIHDDLDLKLGKIKVRQGGAASGHHGVESIIAGLKSDKFIRLRLGIGNLTSHSGNHQRVHFSAEKFVIEPFMSNERSAVKKLLKQAVLALDLLLKEGLEKTQNQYN